MRHEYKSLLLVALLALFYVGTATAGTTNINFDEFKSPPVTCCYADTGVLGPLVYPSVTVADGGGTGFVMNNTGWNNMATSAPNLFGTLTGTIFLNFTTPVSSLSLDVINGVFEVSTFTLDLYGPGAVLINSYSQTLNEYSSLGSVGHFAPGDSGILQAVITGNGDFAIDTVSYNAVPEPGTLLLLGSGIIGLAGVVRRKLIF